MCSFAAVRRRLAFIPSMRSLPVPTSKTVVLLYAMNLLEPLSREQEETYRLHLLAKVRDLNTISGKIVQAI